LALGSINKLSLWAQFIVLPFSGYFWSGLDRVLGLKISCKRQLRAFFYKCSQFLCGVL